MIITIANISVQQQTITFSVHLRHVFCSWRYYCMFFITIHTLCSNAPLHLVTTMSHTASYPLPHTRALVTLFATNCLPLISAVVTLSHHLVVSVHVSVRSWLPSSTKRSPACSRRGTDAVAQEEAAQRGREELSQLLPEDHEVGHVTYKPCVYTRYLIQSNFAPISTFTFVRGTHHDSWSQVRDVFSREDADVEHSTPQEGSLFSPGF